MEFKPSEKWEFNVHIIKANNLPSADSNGLSDPYCLFKILNMVLFHLIGMKHFHF